MSVSRIKLGIVGVGKIVRDQHLASIEKNGSYELIACASRNASIDGVASFTSIEEMLEAVPDLEAVALCMPPQYRYQAAHLALSKGKHVLLEKPPGATVSEVEQLAKLAEQQDSTLYTTWHSRHGAAVEQARVLLAGRDIKKVKVDWKEDVRKWHPKQEWIWQAGGLGVFDPGINGLSILTHILPAQLFVSSATLSFPQNKAAPIAADITFRADQDLKCRAEFDWRQSGGEVWNINVETDTGTIILLDGGAGLIRNGEPVEVAEASAHGEYEAIYAHFAELIRTRQSDVDLRPLKLVADAFLLGSRESVEPFVE